MTFLHFLAGLALLAGVCAGIAAVATVWMVSMARLEMAVVTDRRAPRRHPAPRR